VHVARRQPRTRSHWVPLIVEERLAGYFRYLLAERNLSQYTLRNYRSDLSHFFAYMKDTLEAAPLDINRGLFRAYLAQIRADGFAPASITRKVSTIHSFYRYLLMNGHTDRDLLSGVSAPKKPKRLPSFLSQDRLEALLESASGTSPLSVRDRAILELLYASGIRLSEVTSANLADLDLEEQTLRVRGKGNKERIVLMGNAAKDWLRTYLEGVRPNLAVDSQETAIFLSRQGGRLSSRSVQKLVRKYAKKAHLPQGVWPHLLRHTFATHMLDGGAELRVVQELLGHSDLNTTQIYLHVTEERQRQKYTEAFYNPVWQKSGKEKHEDTSDKRS